MQGNPEDLGINLNSSNSETSKELKKSTRKCQTCRKPNRYELCIIIAAVTTTIMAAWAIAIILVNYIIPPTTGQDSNRFLSPLGTAEPSSFRGLPKL